MYLRLPISRLSSKKVDLTIGMDIVSFANVPFVMISLQTLEVLASFDSFDTSISAYAAIVL